MENEPKVAKEIVKSDMVKEKTLLAEISKQDGKIMIDVNEHDVSLFELYARRSELDEPPGQGV